MEVGHHNSPRLIRILGISATMVLGGCLVFAAITFAHPHQEKSKAVGASRAPSSSDLSEIEKNLVSSVAREIQDDITKEVDKLVQEGRRIQATADQLVILMQLFIGFASLAFIIFGGLGFFELWQSRGLRAEAQKSLEKAEEVVKQARDAATRAREESNQITEMRNATDQAWLDIETSLFEKLPSLERTVPTGLPIYISEDERNRYEDADVLLMVCDRLGYISDRKKASKYYVSIGQYWAIVGDYVCSLTRLERGIALDPNSVQVRTGLAATFMYYGAETETVEDKDRLLGLAEREVENAKDLLGRHDAVTLQILGWIYDERRSFLEAAEFYRAARDQDRNKAGAEGREEDWNITYNLSCTLAKAGSLEGAFNELKLVIHKDGNWKWAEEDPDFIRLRDDPHWGSRVSELIRETRLTLGIE